MLVSKPVKILAVYLSPSRSMIASDLSACPGGGLPVFMASDLNSKHLDWNSRLVTKIGRPLRDYADNSCLIYGPNKPTTIPHNPSATPDVLEIVITKDLVTPVYLTTCSAMSWDHLPILIDARSGSSFLNIPDLRRTDWSMFYACLEAGLPPNPDLPNEMAIDACVKELSSAISKALAESNPKCRPRDNPRPPILARIQDGIRLKPGYRGSGKSLGTPL
jgi:hypothetical protein